MFKRFFFFIICNLVVTATLLGVIALLGVRPYLTRHGLDLEQLALFSLIWGMGGALISLLLSRKMARWMLGVKRVPAGHPVERAVHRLAKMAGMTVMPEVGIFPSKAPNAFATGPSQRRSLVAVSSGLLEAMDDGELEAVLGHEISHIVNGDMVTMTLLQGVVNAFVIFLSRVAAFALTRSKKDNRGSFYLFTWLFEIAFMLLGSMVVCGFSRWREFRADRGGAQLAGRGKMIAALEKLGAMKEARMPEAVRALMMHGKRRGLRLFMTHPPLEERIKALQQ